MLDIFPNLTMHNKTEKVVVENTFFIYLCRDAIDDAESINFEVSTIHTQLSNLAKAYLGKTEFGMARGDMA
ncbi:hypothetical protein SLA2020_041930 [Shorea laevis]